MARYTLALFKQAEQMAAPLGAVAGRTGSMPVVDRALDPAIDGRVKLRQALRILELDGKQG